MAVQFLEVLVGTLGVVVVLLVGSLEVVKFASVFGGHVAAISVVGVV